MSADTDAVTLAIAGHEHRDWERYSIDSDFFTPADAWSLSLGIPATAIPDYVKPWAEVQVRLGTDVILTGRVDAVRRRLAKGEHRLELHGRDRAGVLLDCSAPVLARRELWSVIRSLRGHTALVLTTHYLEEAEALSDRIGIMSHGRLIALGTAQELIEKTGESSFENAFIALAGEGDTAK